MEVTSGHVLVGFVLCCRRNATAFKFKTFAFSFRLAFPHRTNDDGRTAAAPLDNDDDFFNSDPV